jgi:hypothetical protein
VQLGRAGACEQAVEKARADAGHAGQLGLGHPEADRSREGRHVPDNVTDRFLALGFYREDKENGGLGQRREYRLRTGPATW